MIYKEDFEEHDHEIICFWDEEKEDYKKEINERLVLLEKELKEMRGNLAFTYDKTIKLREDFSKLVGIVLRNLVESGWTKIDRKILNELLEGE